MSPLLCGYIGETYGWRYGFGLATVGMLTGLAVFVVPRWLARIAIVSGAIAAAAALLCFHPVEVLSTAASVFVAVSLLGAAAIAAVAIGRGGLPTDAGAPPYPERLRRPLWGMIPIEWVIYLGALVLFPLFVLLVSAGAPLRASGRPLVFIEEASIKDMETSETAPIRFAAVLLRQVSTPAGVVLVLSTLVAFAYLLFETFRLEAVGRHRMYVVLILTFFCMLFWAFFEQAGSSINNFTDRNVDRVPDRATIRTITESDIGQTIRLEPTQQQIGFHDGDRIFTLDVLNELRKEHDKAADFEVPWKVAKDNVGMHIARRADEIPASLFQSANPIYILLLGLVFTALWTFLGARGLEPSTPLKFALGLLQLGLGFAVVWWGAQVADARGMVAMPWLLLMYLLHTTAELCLSPVGLAMITKLSPARLVSTVMGGWFLATAVSQFLAGMIAQFTRVEDGGAGSAKIPPPSETLHTYGDVYGIIAIAAVISAAICFALVPLLKKWMHEGESA
jgi:POT family proton-dependent oligopeptide transporter